MEQGQEIFNRRALGEAGVSYSVGIVLYVVVTLVFQMVCLACLGEGYAQSGVVRFLAYLLPQVCFAAAALVFFRRSKAGVRSVYRACKWYYFPLALLLQFGLLFSLAELNTMFSDWLASMGYRSPSMGIPPLEGWNMLPALLIVALLPALFEETLFRGIFVGRMHASGWGSAATVCISGALFALYHGSPVQTLYQFACGACFALLTLRAGSMFPSALAHFCNNAAILILTATGYQTEGGWTMPQGWHIGLIATACAALAAVLLFLLLDKSNAQKGCVRDGKQFFLGAGVGILVCAVLWISNLVTGLTGV